MQYSDVKFDCKFFRTGIPCLPNKTKGEVCDSCTSYVPVKKKLLVIKLGALGDVIRTTPLLERFHKEHEGLHVTWLTLSPAILPKDDIDEILTWNEKSLYILENTKFDIAINLDKDPEACMLLTNIEADSKFGFTWEDGHIAPATERATHKLMTGFFDDLSQKNTKSYLEEIFEICHFEFNKEEYLIRLNNELSDKWGLDLRSLADGKLIVGLNTGCGPRWNTRLWSEEAWQDLGKDLIALGYFPVFLGGELEDEKNQRMANKSGVYYPGHFSLEEFIALSNATDVIVTQVSMMMHIATALKKKMVLCNTIFNKHEFELYGRGIIIEPLTGCECYFGNTCKRGVSCMHDIEPKDIIEGLKTLV